MEWTKVKDKLPEHGQKVLVVVWDDDIVPCTFIEGSNKGRNRWFPETDAIEDLNGWGKSFGSLACPKLAEEPRLWAPFPEIPSIVYDFEDGGKDE